MKQETLTVSISGELVAAVRNSVASGEYTSDDEAVSAALQEWTLQRGNWDVATLRAALAEADADDRPDQDAFEVLDRLRAEFGAGVSK